MFWEKMGDAPHTMFVSPNSSVEVLTPNAKVLGNGAFGGRLGQECGAQWGCGPCDRDPELQPPAPLCAAMVGRPENRGLGLGAETAGGTDWALRVPSRCHCPLRMGSKASSLPSPGWYPRVRLPASAGKTAGSEGGCGDLASCCPGIPNLHAVDQL